MNNNDKKMTGQLSVRDGALKARVHPMRSKVCLGLLAGFCMASAHAETRILNDPEPQANAKFGAAVDVGDVNNDGTRDQLVGAPGQDGAGKAFVISGATGLPIVTLSVPGISPGAQFGFAVAAADVNGIGGVELLVGAPLENVGGNTAQGAVYVFDNTGAQLAISPLVDPAAQAGDHFGAAVANAGNVDGVLGEELLVGAPLTDGLAGADQGAAYVFDNAGGAPSLTLVPTTVQAGAQFGFAVAGAGLVSADAFPDLLVGAPRQNVAGNTAQGQATVFDGPTGAVLPLLTLNDPNAQAEAQFGFAVAGPRHVGGTTTASDLLVGAPGQNVGTKNGEGQAFVFDGATGTSFLTLNDPNAQTGAQFGFAVAGADDVNGDTTRDLLVGAPGQDMGLKKDQGRAFVLSGVNGSLLRALDDPKPQAHAQFGAAVAKAGDVSNPLDGLGDLLVGAPGQNVGANVDQGLAVYFLSAKCNLKPAVIIGTNDGDFLRGTADNDVIAGQAGNDVISGLEGDDTICGDAGNDLIFGGAGNDYISGGDGNDKLFGGSGTDTVNGDDGNDFLTVRDGVGGDTANGGNPIIPPGRDVCLGDTGDTFLGCNP